jgi:biotin carboxyl carrier protein
MREIFHHLGQSVTYEYQWIQGTLWLHVNGKTYSIQAEQKNFKSRKAQAAVSHNRVLAPMPGKVTKVLVKTGQIVMKGQPVVVMEAMKMEYTLKAELAGPIEKIMAEVGSQVSLGDILIEIEQSLTVDSK